MTANLMNVRVGTARMENARESESPERGRTGDQGRKAWANLGP